MQISILILYLYIYNNYKNKNLISIYLACKLIDINWHVNLTYRYVKFINFLSSERRSDNRSQFFFSSKLLFLLEFLLVELRSSDDSTSSNFSRNGKRQISRLCTRNIYIRTKKINIKKIISFHLPEGIQRLGT